MYSAYQLNKQGDNIQPWRSVQLLSCVWLFVNPWTAVHQASLSITNSQSLLKLMSIESVMPSNRLILWHPLLLPSSVFPSIRVFSNESVLHIRWPNFETVHCSMSDSNCCFLTCIQISQEASQVVWYSRFFKNFPVFCDPHSHKGFGVFSNAEVDVFLELSCFLQWSNGCSQFDLWFLGLF